MSTPVTVYDVIYKHMSDADREKLQEDLHKVLSAEAAKANEQLIEAVQKAATSVYQEILVNPWPALVEENSGNYEFIRALLEHLWQVVLKSDPSNVSKYDMRDLVEAWQKNYPDAWKSAVDGVLLDKITSLEERIAMYSRMNQERYL